MKRPIKRIARLTLVLCFALGVFASCEEANQDIFDNIELEDEQATTEPAEDKKTFKTK